LELAKKEPDKYIENTEYDGIDWGYVGGRQVVYGCPCNRASEYEQFIWNNWHVIERYLSSMAKKKKKEADEESKLAESVETSVEELE